MNKANLGKGSALFALTERVHLPNTDGGQEGCLVLFSREQ